MEENKECPQCKGEMEKGMLSGHGQLWVNKVFNTLAKWFSELGGSKVVFAWSCRKCGYISLYRELA